MFDLKCRFVWIIKYRKKLLWADVAVRLRQLVRDFCSQLEVEILKGQVRKDHVHLFVSCLPHVPRVYLMQRIEEKSSRRLLQEFSYLDKECWGRHLWVLGSSWPAGGASRTRRSIEYIRTPDVTKEDGNFKVGDE